MNGTNKNIRKTIQGIIQTKRSNWDSEIKKLNVQIGAIKCQSEFMYSISYLVKIEPENLRSNRN